MSKQLKYCKILGTNINVINMEETTAYIDEKIENLRGDYICVSNVHTTVLAFRSEAYQNVQNSGAMALPDGKPLSIVCKLRGCREAARVPGPDLMTEIFGLSEKKGYRHYFYGGSEHTLKALEEVLKKSYPKLNIVGMYSPPYRTLTEAEDKDVISNINESRPDFVWVGLGAPKQEYWMADHKGKIHAVMIGVGAGFDFHAGTVKRAPRWMQEWCLEWLYRLSQDPKRLMPRYINTNFSFLLYASLEHRREKKIVRKNYNKIAMIGHKRIPSREGGVEVVVEELSTRYVERGHQVDAYNRSGYHVSGKEYSTAGKTKYYKGIRIFTIPTFRSSKLNAIVYSALATMRAMFTRYDILHYHAEGPCAVLWIPKILHRKIVVTVHGLDWQRAKWGNFASWVLKFGEKMAAKYADEIIVLSRNVQLYFKDTYNRDTRYIPNGVNVPECREADLIKKNYGLEKDGYLLFLARIVPEKGLHYLIEAFGRLDTDKKLVIAGGSSHSLEYMDQVRDAVKKDSRIFMTGFVQGQILEELYSNAYLFVLPSDIEGMAVSLLEAMSYGNCCVVSDICENMEVVQDHAVSFRKGDTDDLERILRELLADTKRVASYKDRSRDFICNRYNWEDVVDQTLEIYKEILN